MKRPGIKGAEGPIGPGCRMCGLVFVVLPWLIAVVALGALLACVMTALAHASAHVVLSRRVPTLRKPRASGDGSLPGISILKPLCGVDDDLEANLASLVVQDYDGPYEILLGAADPGDPALQVARRLEARFPDADIRIVAGHQEPGVNPKVANLAALSAHARHEAWLVSDSNVAVGSDYLSAVAAELADPRVGMVSNPVAGVGGANLGALLENLHLNSFVLVAVCSAEVIAGHPVVIGKSMLLRRAVLAQVGGWARVADFLGEDYVLGAAIARAGYRVVLSPHVVRTVNRTWTVHRFVGRHLRWAQMRRAFAAPIYALEPLLSPLPWLFVLAVLLGIAVPAPTVSLGVLLVAVVTKVALDAVLLGRLWGRMPDFRELAAIPFKDFWVLAIWARGWFRGTVVWRGQRFRIGRGTRLLKDQRTAVAPPRPSPPPWSARPSAPRVEP